MNDIKKKFINTFFSQLTEKDKKECYFDHYMWHAFSYEKIECIEGRKAIEELHKKNNEVYLIFEDNDKVVEKKMVTYKELIDMRVKGKIAWDCYVIDKNFNWCFVLTHETDYDNKAGTFKDCDDLINPYYIGPFFIEIKKDC